MVQLDEARFLSELTKLFQATRDAGSLTITHKRLQQRPKRGQGGDDVVHEVQITSDVISSSSAADVAFDSLSAEDTLLAEDITDGPKNVVPNAIEETGDDMDGAKGKAAPEDALA